MTQLTHNDPIPLHTYTDHGRFYSINCLQYPGVSSILNATDPIKQQEFWQQWRSQPKNQAYSEQAQIRGSMFHAVVEHHFRDSNDPDANELADAQLSKVLPFWQSVQNVLPRISDIQLIESAVWHEVGHYAGTVDMVASFDGIPCILDWKTAAKPKKPQWCDRFPLQLTAYCGAINRMYNTRVKHGVIVIALPNAEAQIFQYPLGNYWQHWLTRLISYWQMQSTPQTEQVLKTIQEEYKMIKY